MGDPNKASTLRVHFIVPYAPYIAAAMLFVRNIPNEITSDFDEYDFYKCLTMTSNNV